MISGHRAGDVVTLTYQRRAENGEYQENTMSVTLGEYPQETETEETQDGSRDGGNGREEYDDSWGDQLFPGLDW